MINVGERLKSLRSLNGLSQRELAKRAGTTNSTISTIEKNNVSPSISSLKRILDAIPISMAEFFSPEETLAADNVFYTASQMIDVGTGGVRRKIIPNNQHGQNILLLDETFPPDTDTGEELAHKGEETGVILEGEIEVTVGKQTRVLTSGDCYHFKSDVPHKFQNKTSKPCRLVCCTTPAQF